MWHVVMVAISQIICVGSEVQNVLTVTSESTEEIKKEILYKTWLIFLCCPLVWQNVLWRDKQKSIGKMHFHAQIPEKGAE